jgi:hypothetical protein
MSEELFTTEDAKARWLSIDTWIDERKQLDVTFEITGYMYDGGSPMTTVVQYRVKAKQ